MQEDVTPQRVVELVEMLRRGEKPPVSNCWEMISSPQHLGRMSFIGFVL